MMALSAGAAAEAELEEMSPNQSAFVEKANQMVSRVVTEVLTTIMASSAMKWSDFVAIHIDPKQQALNEIDQRTKAFFIKMMGPISLEIEAVPTLVMSFQVFEMISRDAQMSKKIVEGIALPHVKTMLTELDAINPSIVNAIISSD